MATSGWNRQPSRRLHAHRNLGIVGVLSFLLMLLQPLAVPDRQARAEAISGARPALAGGVVGPLAIVVSRPSAAASPYVISLVDSAGRITTAVTSTDTRAIALAGAVVPPLPKVSASQSHVYYISGRTVVRRLAANGTSSIAATIPGDAHTRSGFAVMPDESAMAVAVMNYTVIAGYRNPDGSKPPNAVYGLPVHETLFIQDLHTGARHTIFTGTVSSTTAGQLVWPIGWLNGALIVAVGPVGTQNSASNPYSAWYGYHVANAGSGMRLSNVCGGTHTAGRTSWQALGPITPLGTICRGSTSASTATVTYLQSWTGACTAWPVPETDANTVLSPDGAWIASIDQHTNLVLTAEGGNRTAFVLRNVLPVGWIDTQHFLALSLGTSSADGNLPAGLYVFAVSGAGKLAYLQAGKTIGMPNAQDAFQGILPGGFTGAIPHGKLNSGNCP